MTLSPRQQSILTRVIDAYIHSGIPVGSRLITDQYTELYNDSYSPATVRHEMGRLETMGYLTHPHTSSGRVPTDSGYRFYVEHSLRKEEVSSLKTEFRHFRANEFGESDEVFDQFLKVVSRMTQQVCVIALPRRSRSKSRYQCIAQGVSRLIDKPDFQNAQRTKAVLELLEEKIRLTEWLLRRNCVSGVSVSIGEENELHELKDCSIVSTLCRLKEQEDAVFAVIGAKRMSYPKVIAIVEEVRDLIREMFVSEEEDK